MKDESQNTKAEVPSHGNEVKVIEEFKLHEVSLNTRGEIEWGGHIVKVIEGLHLDNISVVHKPLNDEWTIRETKEGGKI